MSSSKFKISIFVALPLVALAAYFASVQLSAPVEQDLMRDFEASQSVVPGSREQDDLQCPECNRGRQNINLGKS